MLFLSLITSILGISLLSCNIALKSFLSSLAILATSYFKDNCNSKFHIHELAMRDAVHGLRFLIAKKLFPELFHLLPDFSWSCDVLILLFHTFPRCGFVGKCQDHKHLCHLVSVQTGMKGFSAFFPAVCTQKRTPLRLILKRSALKVFGTGMCVRLYAVICCDVPSFDFLLHKYCKSGVTAKNRFGFVVKIRRFSACDFPRINTALCRPRYGCPPSEDEVLRLRCPSCCSQRREAFRRSRCPSSFSAGDW